jgi:hypothetical protein
MTVGWRRGAFWLLLCVIYMRAASSYPSPFTDSTYYSAGKVQQLDPSDLGFLTTQQAEKECGKES